MATAEKVMIAMENEIEKKKQEIVDLREGVNHIVARMAHGARPYPKEAANPFLKENAEATKKRYYHLVSDVVEKEGKNGN